MNKKEFLAALRAGLAGLPEADVQHWLDFYSEIIEDRMEEGMTEAEAVADVGPVHDIVGQILSETPKRPMTGSNAVKRSRKPVIFGVLIGASAVVLLVVWGMNALKADFSRFEAPFSQSIASPALTSPVDAQDFHTVRQTVEESFTSIAVDAEACNIHLVPSTDGTTQVEYTTGDKLECSVSVAQNILRIIFRDHRSWTDNMNASPLEITLYLPQSQYEQLNLDSVSGSITVPEDFSFSQAQVSTTSGALKFYAPVSGNLTLESVSGTMEVSNIAPQSLSLSSTSGSIHASQVVVMETWDINSVSGQVTLTDCDASSLVINTISASVKASLRSGKTFSTQTVSGDVEVPSDSSGGSCNISTISGDITCTIQ